MTHLTLQAVTRRFGAAYAVDSVDLSVPDGKLVCFLGPSGCGKTTLLRMIAGLETLSGGEIRLDDEDIGNTPAHSFSANIAPRTLEARALQDADRLEALGAIGLARVFSIAGQLGSSLFNGEDPFAKNRPLDDRRYAVDHFEVKLLRLPETMQTTAGRNMAEERADVMRSFLRSLASELGSDTPWGNAR